MQVQERHRHHIWNAEPRLKPYGPQASAIVNCANALTVNWQNLVGLVTSSGVGWYGLGDFENCVGCVNSFPVVDGDISSYSRWCPNCWMADPATINSGQCPYCWQAGTGDSAAQCQYCLNVENPDGACCGDCDYYDQGE